MKGRSYLANLTYGKATHLEGEGKAVAVAYMDFTEAFTFSHNLLLFMAWMGALSTG